MPFLPADTPLQSLARHQFQDYRYLTAEADFNARMAPSAERSAEFAAWWHVSAPTEN